MAAFTKNAALSATTESMKLYFVASFNPALVRSTARDCTSALCRYKLCGMTVAPMIPMAMNSEEASGAGASLVVRIPGTKPRKIPARSGRDSTISSAKHAPIVATSVRMIASILRMPNDWSSRSSITSSAVINTPARIGIPKSRCSAMADPSTSARSHAAMAISHRIHSTHTIGRG